MTNTRPAKRTSRPAILRANERPRDRGSVQWRVIAALAATGLGFAAPALRDIGRITFAGPAVKAVGTVGDVIGGVQGITSLAQWFWSSVSTHTVSLWTGLLEIGAALGPMATTIAIVCLVGSLRRVLAQGIAHLDLAYLEKHLSPFPSDRQVWRSSGIDDAHFYTGPEGITASPERLWIEVRFLSWRRAKHPMILTSRFERIDVADASIHDVRLFIRAARKVWLSSTERQLVAAVVARGRDLLEWPDSSFDGGDDSGDQGDSPRPVRPPSKEVIPSIGT